MPRNAGKLNGNVLVERDGQHGRLMVVERKD